MIQIKTFIDRGLQSQTEISHVAISLPSIYFIKKKQHDKKNINFIY